MMGTPTVMDAFARLSCGGSRFELSEVRGEDDWREVRRIRERSVQWMTPGLAAPSSPGLAGEPESAAFLVRRNGVAVATAGAVLSGPQVRRGLLSDTVFQADIARQLGARPSYVEMESPAVDSLPHAQARYAQLCLVKAAIVYGVVHGADWLFTAVNEDEIGFHGRMLGMEILSGPEDLPALSRQHVLMGLNLRNQVRELERRLPLFAVTPDVVEGFRQTGHIPTALEAVAGD